jgi:hypothetical protein
VTALSIRAKTLHPPANQALIFDLDQDGIFVDVVNDRERVNIDTVPDGRGDGI